MATILIVDDSPTEAEVVRVMLESEGYSVLWADTADKGIKTAEEKRPARYERFSGDAQIDA